MKIVIDTFHDSHHNDANRNHSHLEITIMTLSIHQFKAGDKAKIKSFNTCDVSYKRQLMALGLTPGTIIDIIRIAPMGDPIQIQVRQSCLALRKHEAAILQLEHV